MKTSRRPPVSRDSKTPEDRFRKVVELLGLQTLLHTRVRSLDEVDQRRVALGVAILRNPAAILLDDPTGGLEPAERDPLLHDVQEALAELELTAMYATGDRAEAIDLGDRIAFLKDGEVQQIGTSAQLAADPATVDVAKFMYGDDLNIMSGRVAGDALLLPDQDLALHRPRGT